MDCYIIRIYRKTECGEIAGMLERVGDNNKGRPFNGYMSLVETMRRDFLTASSDAEHMADRPDAGLRVVHSAKKY